MQAERLKFEDLKVWERALSLIASIHALTKEFPKDELFVLTSQIKRASDSVALNIAEGSTGQTNPEFKRFLTIATRSAIEVIACLLIAEKRGIINAARLDGLKAEYIELIKC